MGGSVNLQGGGQYSMPNIQGYGQNAANIGQSAAGFGSRFGNRGYGPPPQYDGGYGNYGDYGGVSTGGKGFQQPTYQPAPVMQPYVDQVSQGGKGFQPRQTPSQSVAYAPMNIPQMQLAQPAFYYPNIGSQMANLYGNYGIGGLGAMGAFGNYPMIQRQPAPMQMYPALQSRSPSTSTGGKGMRSQPPLIMEPSRPNYGFDVTQPPPSRYPVGLDLADYTRPENEQILRPVAPPDQFSPSPVISEPDYSTERIAPVPEEYKFPVTPPENFTSPSVIPPQQTQPTNIDQTAPSQDQRDNKPYNPFNQYELLD